MKAEAKPPARKGYIKGSVMSKEEHLENNGYFYVPAVKTAIRTPKNAIKPPVVKG